MKYIKNFETMSQYESFKDSEEFILPNVTFVMENTGVLYTPVPPKEPEQTFMLRAKYNATEDNLVAFIDASNIKSLKVNGTPIEFEPAKNDITNFDVLGENISLDVETGAATFPETYLIKSPVSNWSFKAKDPNYVINENTYICILGMMDGMTMAEPIPIMEAMDYMFTTNDGVTLEVADTFLTEMSIQILSGLQIGFILMDVDMNSGTFAFIDTEHQAKVTTGGLPTYSFDSEGFYDVEIEIVNPGVSMYFNETPLISIEIGDGITSISEYTFGNCRVLTSVTIGSDVTEIGDSAFNDCSELTEVTLGSGITTIGNEAFGYCSSLTSIIIPNSVTSIGNAAFQKCSGLTSIVIPDSVTSIGNNAFSDCTSLNSVTIGSGVTSIGVYAFSNCSGLTDVTIGSGVTSIGNAAFQKCSGLTSINIPNSVTSIGNSAFYDCTGLTSVTIGSGVKTIGGYAFENCKGLTSINIPNSVTYIGDGAFQFCSGLTSINIPNSVTSIGNSAFNNCKGLTGELVIPDGVITIGEYAFYDCQRLNSVIIPNSATAIGRYVFGMCSRLHSITCLAPTAPSISKETFGQAPKSGILKVPAGSDYSSWMRTDKYYLGYYNWTIQEF